MNIVNLLSRQAAERPNADALILSDRTISYRALDTLVWKAATTLHRMGIRPGEVVAISFQTQYAALIAMLAIARIGATIFSLPASTPLAQRKRSLAQVGATVVLTDSVTSDSVRVKTVNMDSRELTEPMGVIATGIGDDKPQAPFLIVSGSGSTGEPKAFAITHTQFHARAVFTAASIDLVPCDRVMSFHRIDFTSPKERFLAAFFVGASIVMPDGDRINPLAICRDLGVTVVNSTVFHLESLLASLPQDAVAAFGSLRVLQVGASTVSDSLRRRVLERIGKSLIVRYATNETGLISIARTEELLGCPGTVGHPWSDVTVEVVDGSGFKLPRGATGHIRVRSPGMVHGYLNDDHATRAAFKDGWFYPGDLGAIMADGQLVHLGRSDQMMIMNGINIYPAEIERALGLHPAVRDVAALALRSDIHQEIPICAVTVDPAQPIEARALQQFAFDLLGSRGPKAVVILEALPRNPQGKLIRAQLAQAVLARLKANHGRDAAPLSAGKGESGTPA